LHRSVGIGRSQQGLGLRQSCSGLLNAGVVASGALDKIIEQPIGERLPPFATRLRSAGGATVQRPSPSLKAAGVVGSAIGVAVGVDAQPASTKSASSGTSARCALRFECFMMINP